MTADSICRLCGTAAELGAIPVLSGGGVLAAALTECPACGPWIISKRDSSFLETETAETKRRISERVREQRQADPENPPWITEGFILQCRGG